MRFALFVLLSLSTHVAPLPSQQPLDETRRRVDGIIVRWLDTEDRTADELADTLAGLGRDASPHLCRLLDGDRKGASAEALALALGRVGDDEAVEVLGRLLDSTEVSERRAAVDALGALGRRAASPHLVRAAEDPDALVVRRAESILLGEQQHGEWVASAVTRRFSESSQKTRLARLLAKKGQVETHEALLELATTSFHEDSQLAALQGLYLDARAEDGEQLEHLARGAGSAAIQMQVCLVLGKIRHHRSTRDLIDLLYEDHRGLVANAHWALRRITGLCLKADPRLWEQWWERGGNQDQ